MAKWLSQKLVRQTGKYLVAAEISRRGFTTDFGDDPPCDITVYDEDDSYVCIQVKTSSVTKWQFDNIRRYCDIRFEGKKQIADNIKPCPQQQLITVLVKIDEEGNDRFYILPWERLCGLLADHHKNYLAKHKGIRPDSWNSLHCAISESELEPYRDNWDAVKKELE